MNNRRALVSLNQVNKVYEQGDIKVHALRDLTIDIYFGEFTAIVGPSGSGKSTLLQCLAGLDNITSGQLQVAGRNLSTFNDTKLTKFRRDHIGFVFQAFNLIPTLTAEENITLPQRLSGKTFNQEWFEQVIVALELKDRLKHLPGQLSGGQQQRVAVARALVARPSLLVADEPTGNLDSRTSAEVLNFLRRSVTELGQTVVMVTHDHHAAALADRVLVVRDGQITHDLWQPTEEQIAGVI